MSVGVSSNSENRCDGLQLLSKNVLEYDRNNLYVTLQPDIKSQFDEYLQCFWKQAMDSGLFRYKLDNIETKILPGNYGFVAQLNVNRAIHRRKPQVIHDLKKPFDHSMFNFTKISTNEVLFEIRPLHWKTDQEAKNKERIPVHLVIINVSPLEQYNSLLLPDVYSCSPQILTFDAVRLALETMLLSKNFDLRIGFNSLGAFASVNHLHLHLYELKEQLFLETSCVQQFHGPIYEIQNFPSLGFAFELLDVDNVIFTARCVMKLVELLLEEEVAHNLFITRGLSFSKAANISLTKIPTNSYDAIRIFVWARQFYHGAKNDMAFNPALCELAGHLPIYDKEFFSDISEKQVESVLNEICHSTFVRIRESIKNRILLGSFKV